MIQVTVFTKSNYRNLNGCLLDVISINPFYVTCLVKTNDFGNIAVDFSLNEITKLIHNN